MCMDVKRHQYLPFVFNFRENLMNNHNNPLCHSSTLLAFHVERTETDKGSPYNEP